MSHSHTGHVHGSSNSQRAGRTRNEEAAKKKKADLSRYSLLSQGSRGAQVKLLEKKLVQAGYLKGTPNDTFGKDTLAAVRKYQQDKGLTVDGIVGQQTWGSFFGMKVPPGSEMLRGGGASGGSTGGSSGSSGTSSAPVSGVGSPGASNSAKLRWAMDLAKKLGLTITSTTGGQHAPGSYHYSGRAIDVAGSPAAMAKYYDIIAAKTSPTELFYDPRGGIKHGAQIGAIGGHGDHVHVAF